MALYHVFASLRDQPRQLQCLLPEMSRHSLPEQFIKPYRRGRGLLCGRRIVTADEIRQVRIIKTQGAARLLSEHVVTGFAPREIVDFSRAVGKVLISYPGAAPGEPGGLELGEDVTREYLPPAANGTRRAKLSDHPLLRLAGAALVVVFAGWYVWA